MPGPHFDFQKYIGNVSIQLSLGFQLQEDSWVQSMLSIIKHCYSILTNVGTRFPLSARPILVIIDHLPSCKVNSQFIVSYQRTSYRHRHTDTKIHSHRDIETQRHTEAQRHGHRDTYTHRHRHRHRHTDTHTHTHTHIYIYNIYIIYACFQEVYHKTYIFIFQYTNTPCK